MIADASRTQATCGTHTPPTRSTSQIAGTRRRSRPNMRAAARAYPATPQDAPPTRGNHALAGNPRPCRNLLCPGRARDRDRPASVCVKDEFDAFLECRILAHGFLRVRCGDCAHEKLLAFSCKRRGFCPACGARRMAETAAHLVEQVIPHVPVRQWVVSFPIPLRHLVCDPTTAALSGVAGHPPRPLDLSDPPNRVDTRPGPHQRGDPHPTLRLYGQSQYSPPLPLVLDGVYRLTDDVPVFQPIPAPTTDPASSLTDTDHHPDPEDVDPQRCAHGRRHRDPVSPTPMPIRPWHHCTPPPAPTALPSGHELARKC